MSSRRVALLVFRRPCLVILCSFGGPSLLSCWFAWLYLNSSLPLKVDTSPESFVIRGDEVADRHSSFDAARLFTSTRGPFVLALAEASHTPTPSHHFHHFPILTMYYRSQATGVLTPSSVKRMRAMESEIASRLAQRGFCRSRGDQPDAPCEGFLSVASLLSAPETVLPRFVDLQLGTSEVRKLRSLLHLAGLPDDSHNLSALLPFVTPEILTLSLRSGLLSSISNLSRFPALHQLSRALPGGEEEMRPLLSDALRHLRCQEWEEWRGGLRARGCGPLVNCCRSCERWDVAMRQGVGLYNHTASCPALGLSMCHASADGKSVSFRQLHGSLPSGSSERDFEEGIAQLMQGCAASALGPASFFFPLSYGEGERELLMVRGLIPAGTYRYRFQQARERGELEASAITSYHDFLQAAFLPIQSAKRKEYDHFIQSEVMPIVLEFNKHPAVEGEPRVVAAAYDYKGTATVSWQINCRLSARAVYRGLSNAAWLALVGVALMYSYMTIHLQSPILTTAGLAGVLLSFPTTWAFYSLLLRIRYMGMLNFVALFVIVGIGVDDIFVFIDAWHQAARCTQSDEERMVLAYSRSLHAMTVTSITDSAAFFANVLSSIPVCRVFGVFMGILILVDFAICLTYFPAVVILHHRWLSARSKHGCFKRWLRWGKAQQLLNEAASQQSSSCSEWQTEMQPPPTEFTPHSSGPIEPKPAVNTSSAFVSWGLLGIDRSLSDPNDPQAGGSPLWALDWSPGAPAAQLAVLELCTRGVKLPFVLHAHCFMSHFARWVEALRGEGAFPVGEEEFEPLLSRFVFYSHRSAGSDPPPCSDLGRSSGDGRRVGWGGMEGGSEGGNETRQDERREGGGNPASQRKELGEIGKQVVGECDAYHATDTAPGEDWSDLVRWDCPSADRNKPCLGEDEAPPIPPKEGDVRPALRMLTVRFNVSMRWDLAPSESHEFFAQLEDLLKGVNALSPPSFRGVQCHEKWRPMRTEDVLVPTTARGCVAALALAFVCLGWSFSFVEAMCVTVIAGFSVDFTAHIAIAYTAASGTHVTSYARCQSALSQLGV
ncbi:MAG: hypothetical protein SGPRY_009105, partial [Prymnesium sp.]